MAAQLTLPGAFCPLTWRPWDRTRTDAGGLKRAGNAIPIGGSLVTVYGASLLRSHRSSVMLLYLVSPYTTSSRGRVARSSLESTRGKHSGPGSKQATLVLQR